MVLKGYEPMLKYIAYPYLLLLILSIHAVAQTFTVSGRVLDQQEKPIPGAAIQLVKERHKFEVKSDSNGSFAVEVKLKGTYDVIVNAETFHPLYESVELAAGTADLQLQLTPL